MAYRSLMVTSQGYNSSLYVSATGETLQGGGLTAPPAAWAPPRENMRIIGATEGRDYPHAGGAVAAGGCKPPRASASFPEDSARFPVTADRPILPGDAHAAGAEPQKSVSVV